MTGQHDDDHHDARAILQRLTVPEHRATFWDELDRRLDALPPVAPAIPGTPAISGGPAISTETHAAGPGRVIELTPAERSRQSWRRLAAAAAAVAVVGLTAVGIAVATRGDGDDVQVTTPATTATTAAPTTAVSPTTAVPTTAVPPTTATPPTTAAPTTAVPSTSTPVGGEAGEGAAGAQAAVIEWIDLLAAGDMEGAWARLGPAAQAGWGSFAAFEDARTAFAEGFGTWASAEGRQAGVATVTRTDQGTLHVVTLTGVRYPEGNREDTAVALPVWEDADGNYLVEPPSPAGAAGVQFTAPEPSPTPPAIGAGDPVVVATSGPVTVLSLVVDQDGEVVTPVLGSDGTASHVPPDGWSPGRHVVTAALLGADGSTGAAAVVFDVA